MQVTLIASTQMRAIPESVRGTNFDVENERTTDSLSSADTLSHFAGRACYQSWEMPNQKTSSNMGYMANIISQGHFSVLEHGSATFYLTGVSRNLTHELVRHRHLSYSELSQRYVDMSEANFVIPPALRTEEVAENGLCPIEHFGDGDEQPYEEIDTHPLTVYLAVVEQLVSEGRTRKQAREAARFYLPSGMETKIVVTGNHRAWRDMLHKRYSVHADAEIRELATLLLGELRKIAPAIYQDFPEDPFE